MSSEVPANGIFANVTFSPGRLPLSGEPAASHSAYALLRSTRCAAFGQPMSKSSVCTVSSALALVMRSLYGRHAADSSLQRNRVPIEHACAPAASAAARLRPSATPPAAITGSGFTASTTAGTMHLLCERLWIATEEHEQRNLLVEARLDLPFLEERQDDVHAERLVGER